MVINDTDLLVSSKTNTVHMSQIIKYFRDNNHEPEALRARNIDSLLSYLHGDYLFGSLRES